MYPTNHKGTTMHHNFTPSHYFRTIGTHPVALTVTSGDSVTIACVDAHGIDGNDVEITPRGNPMSGPIAVTGVAKGDVLAVTFDALIPLRSHGWSYPTLAGNVVDPEYIRELPTALGSKEYWDYDATTRTLRSRGTHGKALTIDYAPMVGCFGVAPRRGEAISTATSGPYGGNMDYRFLTTGCTIYFPVAVSGALFFIGDGHLAQGCGEIGGTGVESAMAVTVTLARAAMQSISWPRAEDATHLYAIGNARPLDQALQHATSEMHRMLIECGADATTAAVLMSQAIEYNIGNVFDPAYTVACKIAKSVLVTNGLTATFRP
jgi:acetamidase/formamidase